MVSLDDIRTLWLKRKKSAETDKCLTASLDDLMVQRRNVRYLHVKNRLDASIQAGDVKSAFKGRGIEMEEIREYAFGDDVRDIDWRVTARKNAPYTKVYNEERDREIYVLLDLSSSMFFGTRKELKSVTASKIAALLGWMAQENNDRFGAVIFDGTSVWQFKPQQNMAQLLAIFKKISEVSRNQGTVKLEIKAMAKTLQKLIKGLKSRATVFVVSDFACFGDEEKEAMAVLAKKTKVFCINVYDVLEKQAPAPGEYMIANDGETLVFDSRNKLFDDEYSKFFAEKRMKMQGFCQKFGCRWLEVRTDLPITSQMKII